MIHSTVIIFYTICALFFAGRRNISSNFSWQLFPLRKCDQLSSLANRVRNSSVCTNWNEVNQIFHNFPHIFNDWGHTNVISVIFWKSFRNLRKLINFLVGRGVVIFSTSYEIKISKGKWQWLMITSFFPNLVNTLTLACANSFKKTKKLGNFISCAF